MSDKKTFFKNIYEIVSLIPEGRVISYGRIAAALGRPRAGRIVGTAMRRAPSEINLPCHRVVGKNGAMAPGDIFGGESNQRKILEKEGITFNKDGNINMKECEWDL